MDLELRETGNGGSIIKKPKDLSVISGFENFPYLAMFGGNVEQSTPNLRAVNEQDFSWWGNALLIPNDQSVQFNSLTERTLMQVALNSSGRMIIEQAVKKDLEFMNTFANVDVSVSVVSDNRILIKITIIQPDNLQGKEFIYIWDATRRELIDREFIIAGGGKGIPVPFRYFDDEFADEFE